MVDNENEDEKRKRKRKLKSDGEGDEEEDKFDWQPKPKYTKLVEFYRETDTKDVIKKSDMFKGMEFYIVNVDENIANKPFLESRIVENGGKRV